MHLRGIKTNKSLILQLPPEVLDIILGFCINWLALKRKTSKTGRGGISASERKEVTTNANTVKKLIKCNLATTCKWFNEIVKGIKIQPLTSANATFTIYGHDFNDTFLRFATIDLVTMLINKRVTKNVQSVLFDDEYTVTEPHPYGNKLIKYIIKHGQADMLINLRRKNILYEFPINSLRTSDGLKGLQYLLRYKQFSNAYDIGGLIEGVCGNVAVRAAINWLTRMHSRDQLYQYDICRILKIISRVHPDHAHYVFNYINKLASVQLGKQLVKWPNTRSSSDKIIYRGIGGMETIPPVYKYKIGTEEIIGYAIHKYDSDYCKFLVSRLNTSDRIHVVSHLVFGDISKYANVMVGFDVDVCVELMTAACKRLNKQLADFCVAYANNIDYEEKGVVVELYNQYFKPYSRFGASSSYNVGVNASNHNGLCYQACPAGYSRRSMTPSCGCTGSLTPSGCGVDSTYMMNFGMYSGDYQPSGSLNISTINPPRFIQYTYPYSSLEGAVRTHDNNAIRATVPQYGDLFAPMTLQVNLPQFGNNVVVTAGNNQTNYVSYVNYVNTNESDNDILNVD